MHVENNSAHASLSQALAARAAAQANAARASTADGSGAPKTDPADAAKAPPVIDASRNTLSKDVLDQVIRAQEAGTEQDKGVLSDIDRRHLERVANDPAYAAETAKTNGTGQRALWIRPWDLGLNPGDDINQHPQALQKLRELSEQYEKIAERDLKPRKVLYEKSLVAGVPPAQIYADILKLNAGNSEFNAIVDRSMKWPDGHLARQLQAEHDYLQDLIDRKDATASAASDTTGTEAF